MTSDYLWDRSGEPDALVASLEETLGELRFEPIFVVEPGPAPVESASPVRTAPGTLVIAMAAAVAAAVLIFWGGYVLGSAEDAAQNVALSVPPSNEVRPHEPLAVGGHPLPPAEAPEPVASAEPVAPEQPPMADAKTPVVEHVPEAEPRRTGRAKRPRPKPKRKPTSAPDRDRSTEESIDCILDPSKCKGASPPIDRGSLPSSTRPDADPALPLSLSASEVREGVLPFKAEAKQCGKRHAAPAGAKIKVKATVSGKTGRITRATATGDYSGTEVGRCVAKALSKATFHPFRRHSIGFVFPITL